MDTFMAGDFKNILIIKPSALGDIVMALPALSALRRNFPKAKITWLIRPEFATLIKDHPHLNDIILFDRRFLGKAWRNPRAFGAILSLIATLRRSGFDAVFDLQGLFRTAGLAWLSGCKKRFGMQNAREGASLFYTHKVPHSRDRIHVVDAYLEIVQAAGASDLAVEFVFPQDRRAADAAEKLLTAHNVDINNYAVFVPGSAHPNKCWPPERFALLADKISSQFGLAVAAVGSASEKPVVQKIKNLANLPVTDLTGLTGLNELTALLKSARIVISNDTGPGHIAAALGVPLVMIFGWSNPARIIPYGRKHCAIAGELDTRGLKIKSTSPKHDVKSVTLDEVYQRVCRQLQQPLSGAGDSAPEPPKADYDS